MISGLIGYKLGMTQVFSEANVLVPVTVLQLGPCRVSQLKTLENDGYSSAQLAIGEKKEKHVSKPLLGHFKRAALKPAKALREFRGDVSDLVLGQEIKVDLFGEGDFVDVIGTSKGKGFQGVMKRHNYSGGRATHGSMFHRSTGSIGQSAYPSHVFKNKGMPGQMGAERVTISGLRVVSVQVEKNLLFVSGSVPGAVNSLVVVRKSLKAGSGLRK